MFSKSIGHFPLHAHELEYGVGPSVASKTL